MTTGTPIALMIENVDQRSKDYSDIRDKFRPGHADYTYDAKIRRHRDYLAAAGRSSARTTARVAAGAIARKVIDGVKVRGALVRNGAAQDRRDRWDWAEIERNPALLPRSGRGERLGDYLDGIRKAGSSVGAVIRIVAEERSRRLGRADPIQSSIRNRRRADDQRRERR